MMTNITIRDGLLFAVDVVDLMAYVCLYLDAAENLVMQSILICILLLIDLHLYIHLELSQRSLLQPKYQPMRQSRQRSNLLIIVPTFSSFNDLLHISTLIFVVLLLSLNDFCCYFLAYIRWLYTLKDSINNE